MNRAKQILIVNTHAHFGCNIGLGFPLSLYQVISDLGMYMCYTCMIMHLHLEYAKFFTEMALCKLHLHFKLWYFIYFV